MFDYLMFIMNFVRNDVLVFLQKQKIIHSTFIIVLKYCFCYKLVTVIPVGIWCQNDVVITSMRRDDVASTFIRRHFYVECPLG